MSRVRHRDTNPERKARRILWRLGFRYRLHSRGLPGTPDIVFASRQKVIFVHGCFWHRHPGCKNTRLPKSRLDFWGPKLRANRLRDLKNQRRLRRLGWDYMVVWECELSDPRMVASRFTRFLASKVAA